MDATVERLRREKAEYARSRAGVEASRKRKEDEDFKAGQRAGRLWVKGASYEELIAYKPFIGPTIDLSGLESIQDTYGQSPHWVRGWLESIQEILEEIERTARAEENSDTLEGVRISDCRNVLCPLNEKCLYHKGGKCKCEKFFLEGLYQSWIDPVMGIGDVLNQADLDTIGIKLVPLYQQFFRFQKEIMAMNRPSYCDTKRRHRIYPQFQNQLDIMRQILHTEKELNLSAIWQKKHGPKAMPGVNPDMGMDELFVVRGDALIDCERRVLMDFKKPWLTQLFKLMWVDRVQLTNAALFLIGQGFVVADCRPDHIKMRSIEKQEQEAMEIQEDIRRSFEAKIDLETRNDGSAVWTLRPEKRIGKIQLYAMGKAKAERERYEGRGKANKERNGEKRNSSARRSPEP